MVTVAKGRETRGRPKSEIDWGKVDELLEAGCLGTEVAAFLGVNPATLYDRCFIDNKKLFSEYSQEKQSKGDSILRKAQFDKALSGDTSLMIWMGKCRLKQIDASQLAASQAQSELKINVINYNNDTPPIPTP